MCPIRFHSQLPNQVQQACHGPPGSLFWIGELKVEDVDVTYKIKDSGGTIEAGDLGELGNPFR